jgi:predicted dehydrogenase/threonine dehydrogenase-like Zn-dependent dehydrogenase
VKQIAQYQDGRIELQETPVPTAPPNGILVRLTHSVISLGTEKMKVEQARMNLLQKARARPDQVRKVLDTARNLGWRNAFEKVRNRLESPAAMGYSAAGIVEAVDPANTRFRVGDRVACGGAECAFHAEYIAIPDMLAAPVPREVPMWQAAYTTLCSISIQAVRQTAPSLGDRVLVIGQGLVGLLITNLLKASGARVIAVDLLESRRKFSEAMGAEKFINPGEQNFSEEIRAWTDGYGVDAAIICTSTQSNTPVEQAAEAARDRARLVIVGITKVELPWRQFSEKELDVRFSRSYGPGRYDPAYEWGGNDYPIGYVRWTEQRNFQATLQLMAQGQINLEAITTRRVPFAEALETYASLGKNPDEIGIVLEYAGTAEMKGDLTPVPSPERRGVAEVGKKRAKAVERLDIIGAGNFARTMLIPHLIGKVPFGTVVNATSLSANHVKNRFGFQNAATDVASVFKDKAAAGVIIATRHHQHAPQVLQALAANREIFVEKPICLTRAELAQIEAALEKSTSTIQVGYNRRFAPASAELKKQLANASGPKTISYRVNAAKLDPAHWMSNLAESGGRVLGEASHFFDYFCFLFDAAPVRIFVQPTWPVSGRNEMPDSISAQVEFADGSSAQLLYSAQGDTAYPKESFTVFASGLVADVTNFLELRVFKSRKETKTKYTSKGHAEQMAAWLAFLKAEAAHPFPYAQSRAGLALTFAALDSIQQGRSINL